MTDYTIGSTYHGFLLQRMEHIAEIHSTVYLFEHELLGTPALAIKNDDPNKTFCMAFQTIPEDSTGVAHILEHSVLMGSKKYPVHDVFGEINKGGLMTFLNAMTGSDTTWYPFATRNTTEYFNIMDVYCDVTLNPLLLRTTFEQEGWHFHKESPKAPLQYQGVVFNEMKGAFSDPFRAIFHHTFKGLMPGSTYVHESGGDPRHIPDLSYEQFVAFHKAHYHPSNAMVFFYGNADLDRELAAVQDNFFSSYAQPGIRAEIVQGRDISEPIFIEDSYPVQLGSELTGKTFLSVGSAVGTVVNRKRNAAFQIIANILYNSDASPLKKAILCEGLCKDFGGLFLDSSCYKTFMMTYLVGSDADKRDHFLKVYQQSLAEIARQGIERDLILSELNKYEFSVREELTKSQRGLDLIGKALPALKHGTDPFKALQIERLFAEIRHQALDEQYFEQLIREYLLENNATVVLTLTPDPEKATTILQEEQQRLADYEQALTLEELNNLISRTRELIKLQHTPNDEQVLALLPRLSRDDLDRSPNYHHVRVVPENTFPLMVNKLDTNAIMYMELGLDCGALAPDLLPFLDLFGTIATELGTRKRDYVRFAKDINIYTGGFSHSFATYLKRQDNTPLRAILWFRIKSLSNYIPQAVELVSEVFADLDFSNRQRIREIVQREFAWSEHHIQSEGYNLASSRVFSQLSRAGMINEYVNGATAYLTLKKLAGDYDSQESKFIRKLEEIRDLIFRKQGLTISMTGAEPEITRCKALCEKVHKSLADGSGQRVEPDFPTLPRNQAFCTATEVVYNVQGCNLFADRSAYNGHFEVLKTWLSRDYLWNMVRQVGGAYGCFIQFNHITGNFGLVSYRDPKVAETFEAYNAIPDALGELKMSRSVLDQLIIGTYGSFNPHQSPAARGLSARNEFLSGITPEYKLQRIAEIIDTTLESICAYAPIFETLRTNGIRASIGNCDKIRKHGQFFDDIVEL